MATTGAKTFQNYIGGEWVDAAGGETFESHNPATGELIGVFPKSGRGRRPSRRGCEGRLRELAPGARARSAPRFSSASGSGSSSARTS